ncbi:hypothetical protein DFJ74DRAFT_775681 [Hyaloraphidium curvatum]|nr:hypothetical protein DFJ74DRAFT_775681 [Hyaloraphidium curvatum]
MEAPGDTSPTAPDYLITMIVQQAGCDPTRFKRGFAFSPDAMSRAVRAGTFLSDFPAVAGWKAAAVDSRAWKCAYCGGRAATVDSVAGSAALPGSWPPAAVLTCLPVCRRGEYADAVSKLKAFMGLPSTAEAMQAKLRTAMSECVGLSLWSPPGVVDDERHEIGRGGWAEVSETAAVKAAIVARAFLLRTTLSGERRKWLCARCGAVSSAFFVGFDAAGPEASGFPANAASEAGTRAGGDPDGVAEGSFCTACPSTSTERTKGMQRCGRCRSARYCSAECQRKDWARHKGACMPKEGT